MFATTAKLYSLPFISYLRAYFQTFVYETKQKIQYVKRLVEASLKNAIYTSASLPTFSFRYLARMRGYIFKSRKAITEEYAVDLIIVFLLAAILFPIAQNQLVTATTTNWNSAVIVMFEVLLPILVVVTLVRHFA